MRPCIFWDCEVTTPDKGMVQTPLGPMWPFQVNNSSIWEDYPFHISCISLRYTSKRGNYVVVGGGDKVAPNLRGLSRAECTEVLELLAFEQANGTMLFTHNGTSFDYRLLGMETGNMRLAAQVALNSYDLCLQILATMGYPVSLNNLAVGMGLPGKLEKGEDAPLLWEAEYFERVLRYVSGDTLCLQRVLAKIQANNGRVAWDTKKGDNGGGMFIPKFLTARECLKLPKPDTSWMTHALTAKDQIAWMQNI